MSTSTLIAASAQSRQPSLTMSDVHVVMAVLSKCLVRVGLGRMQIIGRAVDRPGWRPTGFSAVCRFNGDVNGLIILDFDRAIADAVAWRFAPQTRRFSDGDRIQALEILADLVVTDLIRQTNLQNRQLCPESVDFYRPGCWNDGLLEKFPLAVMPVRTPCGECRLAFTSPIPQMGNAPAGPEVDGVLSWDGT